MPACCKPNSGVKTIRRRLASRLLLRDGMIRRTESPAEKPRCKPICRSTSCPCWRAAVVPRGVDRCLRPGCSTRVRTSRWRRRDLLDMIFNTLLRRRDHLPRLRRSDRDQRRVDQPDGEGVPLRRELPKSLPRDAARTPPVCVFRALVMHSARGQRSLGSARQNQERSRYPARRYVDYLVGRLYESR